MHHIQKKIIHNLATKNPARYSDINPDKLDGNQFTYHLKQLLVDNLVTKNTDGTYSLTEQGRSHLIHRYEDSHLAAHSIFLVVLHYQDQLLLRTRTIQPMLDWTGFVHGEPVADVPLEQNVRERVLTKTGVEIDSMTIHGSGLIKLTLHDELQSFSQAIIVEATALSEDLPISGDDTGKNIWVDKNSLLDIEKLIPSTLDILKLCDSASTEWFDHTYHVTE